MKTVKINWSEKKVPVTGNFTDEDISHLKEMHKLCEDLLDTNIANMPHSDIGFSYRMIISDSDPTNIANLEMAFKIDPIVPPEGKEIQYAILYEWSGHDDGKLIESQEVIDLLSKADNQPMNTIFDKIKVQRIEVVEAKTVSRMNKNDWLMCYRPFSLSEKPNFFSITKLIKNRHKQDQNRVIVDEQIKLMRQLWNGAYLKTRLPLVIDDTSLADEEIFKEWLYANPYHRDSKRREAQKRYTEMFSSEFIDAIMVAVMKEKSKVLFNLHSLIEMLLIDMNEL